MLAEQLLPTEILRIQLQHQWLSILGETCCENDKLVVFGHLFQKLTHVRPHQHIDRCVATIDLDSQNNVWVLNLFKT